MNWYLDVIKNKYAMFEGRARRKEYWYFFLVNIIVTLILMGIDTSLGLISVSYGIGPLSGIYSLGVIVPNIAVSIRRLHDTNRSGWWLLISLVPILGGIAMIVLMVLEGTSGNNEYGTDPVTD